MKDILKKISQDLMREIEEDESYLVSFTGENGLKIPKVLWDIAEKITSKFNNLVTVETILKGIIEGMISERLDSYTNEVEVPPPNLRIDNFLGENPFPDIPAEAQSQVVNLFNGFQDKLKEIQSMTTQVNKTKEKIEELESLLKDVENGEENET